MRWRAEVVSMGVGRQADRGGTKNAGGTEVRKSKIERQNDDARSGCKRTNFPAEIALRSAVVNLLGHVR